jgi:hypothetical protein
MSTAMEKLRKMKAEKAKATKAVKEAKQDIEDVVIDERPEVKKAPKKTPKKEEPKKAKKKAKKTEEPKKAKKEEEPKKDVTIINNALVDTEPSVTLPSVKQLFESGKVFGVGRPDQVAKIMRGFNNITFIKLAQAINLPEYAGYFVTGKDENVRVINTETQTFLLLVSHVFDREDFNTPGKFKTVMSLYFYSPETDKIYCITCGGWATDSAREVVSNGIGFYRLESELMTSEFEDRKGKTQKSKFYIPKFVETDYEDDIDEEKLNNALGAIQANIDTFYKKYPDQHPDFDGNSDYDDEDIADIPF